MMRSLGLSLISVALTSIVVANAYYQKKQFYPSVVYITKSNPSMAVSNPLSFVLTLTMVLTFAGNIHPSFYHCVPHGKIDAKSVLWTVAYCRI